MLVKSPNISLQRYGTLFLNTACEIPGPASVGRTEVEVGSCITAVGRKLVYRWGVKEGPTKQFQSRDPESSFWRKFVEGTIAKKQFQAGQSSKEPSLETF